jgi:hypothetical protein
MKKRHNRGGGAFHTSAHKQKKKSFGDRRSGVHVCVCRGREISADGMLLATRRRISSSSSSGGLVTHYL